jgi:hypothetical protein
MTAKSRSVLMVFALVAFIVVLVYLGVKNPRESFEEQCTKSCLPGLGVVQREGPELGPSWRPAQRNVVCVCK